MITQHPISRREMLHRVGGGFGTLGLASLFAHQTAHAATTGTHLAPRARRVIFLFMSGGPSQVDTFDPKPLLKKLAGQRPQGADLRTASPTAGLLPSQVRFIASGQAGIPVSEHLRQLATHVDEMAIVRSMHTDFPNHAPALCMMNLGVLTPTRPSLGAWTSYGLGTENEDLPGFIALCPGKPVVGPKLWGSAFLPGRHQATHINNADLTPAKMIPHLKNEFLSRDDQRSQLDLIDRIETSRLAIIARWA